MEEDKEEEEEEKEEEKEEEEEEEKNLRLNLVFACTKINIHIAEHTDGFSLCVCSVIHKQFSAHTVKRRVDAQMKARKGLTIKKG